MTVYECLSVCVFVSVRARLLGCIFERLCVFVRVGVSLCVFVSVSACLFVFDCVSLCFCVIVSVWVRVCLWDS